MSTRKRITILEEFIELYKSEPCIWRVKDTDYHNREKRSAAYEKLLTKLKKLEPGAKKGDVVKKIKSLRSNIRREKRKIEESMKSGASADEIYKPSLWYYHMFDFLGDQDTPRTSRSNIDDVVEIEETADIGDTSPENTTSDTEIAQENTTQNSVAQEQQEQSTEKPLNVSRPGKKKNKEQDKLTNEVLMSVRDHFKRPAAAPPQQDDRYDLLGKSIALKLRTMEKRQRLIAEKVINDTLFEGEMGNLSSESFQNKNIPHYLQERYISSPSSTSLSSTPRHTQSPSLLQQFQYTQFSENYNSSQNPVLIQLPSTSPAINNAPANVQITIPENSTIASSYFSNFDFN